MFCSRSVIVFACLLEAYQHCSTEATIFLKRAFHCGNKDRMMYLFHSDVTTLINSNVRKGLRRRVEGNQGMEGRGEKQLTLTVILDQCQLVSPLYAANSQKLVI
jgi:hypothetical protein